MPCLVHDHSVMRRRMSRKAPARNVLDWLPIQLPRARATGDVATLDSGVRYVQTSSGPSHTILLRADGKVVATKKNSSSQFDLPSCCSLLPFVGVSVGRGHSGAPEHNSVPCSNSREKSSK